MEFSTSFCTFFPQATLVFSVGHLVSQLRTPVAVPGSSSVICWMDTWRTPEDRGTMWSPPKKLGEFNKQKPYVP